MNFFAAFDAWLRVQLASFIADRTATLAGLIEPFVVTCAVLYVMVWGYLHLTGQIEQPILEGAKRILILAAILGFSLQLWSFNEFFVDTFMQSPQAIANAFAAGGSASTIGVADIVLMEGATVAENLFKQGGVFSGNVGFYLVGGAVYAVIVIVAGYAAFLDALSRIALTVILALGPLFLVGLLFDSTKRFFEAWVAQLTNYALIAILTGAVAGLLMQIVQTEATEMAAIGAGIEIAQVVSLIVACVLILLVMRQVMPIAAGLSSGVALASMGVVSTALAWSLGRTARFGRGMTDSQTSRWDPMSRRLGHYAGMPIRAALTRSMSASTQAARSAGDALGVTLRPRNEIRKAKPR
jgi:type IV secretion system protein VirB6